MKKLFLVGLLYGGSVYGQSSLTATSGGIIALTNYPSNGFIFQGNSALTHSGSFTVQYTTNTSINGDTLALGSAAGLNVLAGTTLTLQGPTSVNFVTPNVYNSAIVTVSYLNNTPVLQNPAGVVEFGNPLANGTLVGTNGTAIRALKVAQATLAAGTVTVSDTSVRTNSIILPSYATFGGVLSGLPFVSSITSGTSYTIKSTLGTDTNVINIILVNQ
jgi:hypothetical protein